MKSKQNISRFLIFCLLLIGGYSIGFAQPANDACSGAQAVIPNGGCTNGTTTNSNDTWIGSVGCQGGGGSNEVWYTFTATANQLNFTINSTGIGNDVEFILAESPCGNCGCAFTIAGSICGPAPLTDSITGLNVGAVYYVTVSSSGTDGDFSVCMDNITAVPIPGQDCNTATSLCDTSSFGIGTISSGNGAINGAASEEDVAALTCFGTSERQSQWYHFSANQSGTIEFNVNPINSGDDYDWALFDITNSGCNLNSGSAPVVACNWSGCTNATGISSAATSEPGVRTGGSGCFGGPAAWLQTPPNLTAGNSYALLIDNFSASNSGFNFTWGGVTGGMTADLGPIADFGAAVSSCDAIITNNSAVPNFTYDWSWGDGTSSSGATPAPHTYTAGTYIITLTVTDPVGCIATTSQTVNISCTLPLSDVSLQTAMEGNAVTHTIEIPEDIVAVNFELEKSRDGQEFTSIYKSSTIASKEGTTYQVKESQFESGITYYRAVAVDAFGTQFHSPIVLLRIQDSVKGPFFSPNPVENQLTVAFESSQVGEIRLEITDIHGQVVSQTIHDRVLGKNQIEFDSSLLPPGIYFAKIFGDDFVRSARFIK